MTTTQNPPKQAYLILLDNTKYLTFTPLIYDPKQVLCKLSQEDILWIESYSGKKIEVLADATPSTSLSTPAQTQSLCDFT